MHIDRIPCTLYFIFSFLLFFLMPFLLFCGNAKNSKQSGSSIHYNSLLQFNFRSDLYILIIKLVFSYAQLDNIASLSIHQGLVSNCKLLCNVRLSAVLKWSRWQRQRQTMHFPMAWCLLIPPWKLPIILPYLFIFFGGIQEDFNITEVFICAHDIAKKAMHYIWNTCEVIKE